MSRIERIVQKIIEWSEENTSGTIMSAENIYLTVRKIDNIINCTRSIDRIIADYESESGYLVQQRDFVSAFELFKS